MTFEQRVAEFQGELETLQKKYSVQVYASQVLLQNGELVTIIKLRDLLLILPNEVVSEKKYDNKSKKGNIINKKA